MPVTLEGSFHSRTIVKTARTLIGYITKGSIGVCAEGRMTILSETLPWHLTYESFAGTLPNVTSVKLLLVGAAFEIEAAGNICRARTETLENAAGIASLGAGGRVEGLRADETRRIRLANGRGGALCSFANGHFIGTGTVTELGNSTPVNITLIPVPGSELEPSPVLFGTVVVGELVRRTVTIRVGAAATVNSIRVAAGNWFAITDPNRCVGARLAERGTCRFSVIFAAPSEAGRSVEDTLSVETSLETLRATLRGST